MSNTAKTLLLISKTYFQTNYFQLLAQSHAQRIQQKHNVFRSVIKLACREGCVSEFLATIVKAFTSVLAPSMTSFMLMAFLPLSLPFFLFFFFNIHFLQMQKQHANTRMIATKAMETMAHEGTGEREQKQGRVWIKLLGHMKHCFSLQRDFRELGQSSI